MAEEIHTHFGEFVRLPSQQEFFPHFSIRETIVQNPLFQPTLQLVQERTKQQYEKGHLILPNGYEEDPRDMILVAQSIQTMNLITAEVDRNRQENVGSIIMLAGAMGAGKTSTIARTVEALGGEKRNAFVYANPNEFERFGNGAPNMVRTADGVLMEVRPTENVADIHHKSGDVVFLVEALFQLFPDGKFSDDRFGKLLDMVDDGVTLVIDSLAYFSNSAPMPVAAEILKRLKGTGVPHSTLFMYSKCSMNPGKMASHCYPMYRDDAGALYLCNPDAVIIERTNTAEADKGYHGFLPVSTSEHLRLAHRFDPNFNKEDDGVYWNDPSIHVPLFDIVGSNNEIANLYRRCN